MGFFFPRFGLARSPPGDPGVAHINGEEFARWEGAYDSDIAKFAGARTSPSQPPLVSSGLQVKKQNHAYVAAVLGSDHEARTPKGGSPRSLDVRAPNQGLFHHRQWWRRVVHWAALDLEGEQNSNRNQLTISGL